MFVAVYVFVCSLVLVVHVLFYDTKLLISRPLM